MSGPFPVEREERLVAFLRARFPQWKRTTVERHLAAGRVRVNGRVERRNAALAPGDAVELGPPEEPEPHAPAGITVLHHDEHLIAIDKPAGLLSVASPRQRERTALAFLRAMLARGPGSARLWPVHRLDRETSGVLLFARTEAARRAVQARWDEARKTYLAVVAGVPAPAEGVIDQPLFEDARLFVHVGAHPEARAARTRYRTRETRAGRSLLEVELESGRRHQIRAHLAWLGHPVLGDPRYGPPAARMGLHALRLALPHPSGARLELTAPPPAGFLALLRS